MSKCLICWGCSVVFMAIHISHRGIYVRCSIIYTYKLQYCLSYAVLDIYAPLFMYVLHYSIIFLFQLKTCWSYCFIVSMLQMSAYFAPAFFSHLFGKCLRRKNPVFAVIKLGTAVIVTFVIVWWPYLHSLDDFLMVNMYLIISRETNCLSLVELRNCTFCFLWCKFQTPNRSHSFSCSLMWSKLLMMQVLSRLAPFERGIYEDYVANFWCTTSILIKWKKLFTTQSLKSISLAATVLASLPSMVQQILSPSNEGFLYGLLNSSMAFYLFSFQGIYISIWSSISMLNLVTIAINYYLTVPFVLLCLNLQCMRNQSWCLFSLQHC